MPINKNTKLRIELFDKKRHNYKEFNCGVDRLNNYFIRNSPEQQAADMVRVYVVVEDGEHTVLGFIVLNVGDMDASALTTKPKGTPSHNKIPVLFLSRIATDQTAAGNGIGGILMSFAFEKAIAISNEAGCFGIVLDVFEDGGEEVTVRRRQWYADYGFQSFPSDVNRMYVTTQYILQTKQAAETA